MNIISFKQFLLEYGYRSQIYSRKILNELLLNKKFEDSVDRIKHLFPIDDIEISKLIECLQLIKKNISINENTFKAHEDYCLKILNKLFDSNNSIQDMAEFLYESINEPITDLNEFELYTKFHSRFGRN